MEFHIDLQQRPVDPTAIERGLQQFDPAAIAGVDAAGTILRISTSLDEEQIASALLHAGAPFPVDGIQRQPSTCCGGCGG